MTPPIVVMGVSGSGKTTVGQALAARLGTEFMDGDDLHSEANVAKMASGQPLDDDDRRPWLQSVGTWLNEHADGGVIACSALRRTYRDLIRHSAPEAFFLYLSGDPDVLARRVANRPEHFMPESLLASQLATLEPLQEDESGMTIDFAKPVDEIVDLVIARWRLTL